MGANDRDVRVKFTAKDETGKAVSGLERRLAGLQSTVKKLGAAIGVTFVANKIIAFGRSAVEEFAKSRGEAARLSGAIENLGTASAGALPQAQALVKSLAKLSGRDDGAITDAFANLITKTGSLAAAQSNLALVLDVAAKKQIDLVPASDLVGQALNGNAKAFKELGIVTGSHAEKMEELRKRYAGFAENEGRSLTGQLGSLSNAWSDLKKAVGEALTQTAGGQSVIVKVTEVLTDLTNAIKANPDAVRAMGHGVETLARGVLAPFVMILGESVRLLAQFTFAVVGLNRAVIASRRLFGQSSPEIEKENAALMEKVRAYEAVANAASKAAHVIAGTPQGKIIAATNADLAILAGNGTVPGAGGGIDNGSGALDKGGKQGKSPEDLQADRIRILTTGAELDRTRAESVAGLRDVEADLMRQMEDSNLTLEKRIELEDRLATVRGAIAKAGTPEVAGGDEGIKAVSTAIEQIGSDADIARGAVEALMQSGSAKGVIKDLAATAKVKVVENVARAIEQYAKGTAAASVLDPAAPGHFAAAKLHGAAALKWAALGAGAGAAGGGNAGGARGGGGGASTTRSESDRLAGTGRGETTVIFPAGRKVILDPTNPDDVDGFARFVESLAGQRVQIRYGGS